MKKLTPEFAKKHDALYGELGTARDDIDKVVQHINDMIERQLSDAIAHYNDVLLKCVDFRDEVVAKMDEYIEERPEDWSEKDEGELYTSWKEEWDGANLEPLGSVEPIQFDDEDIAEDFGSLDAEPR